MTYGQYVSYKTQTRFPSYAEYINNKARGITTYQTYGPLQAMTNQYSTVYPRSPGYIPGMPTIERISIESGECSGPPEDAYNEQLLKALAIVAKIYLTYTSFENGMESAVLRNYGGTLRDIIAGVESLRFDGKTPAASDLNSIISSKLRQLEQNSPDKIAYNIGLIGGDIGVVAIDLIVLRGAGKVAGKVAEGALVATKGSKKARLVLAGIDKTIEVVIAGEKIANVAVAGTSIIVAIAEATHIAGDITSLKDAIDDAKKESSNLSDAKRQELIEKYEEHIFSKNHRDDSIMDLGDTRDEIMNNGLDVIDDLLGQGRLSEGSTTIITEMNGEIATIRTFVQDGEVLSFNIFKGISNRVGNEL